MRNSGCPRIYAGEDVTTPRKTKVPWREFLSDNRNETPFATNHFQTAARARKFFRELEKAGATQVTVSNVMDEPFRLRTEGGAYADTVHFCIRPKNYDALPVVAREKPDTFGPTDCGCFAAWWD